MKTTIEFIKLTIVTVGGALAILLLTGVASFAKEKYLSPEYSFYPDQDIKWAEKTGSLGGVYEISLEQPKKVPHSHAWTDEIVRDGKYAIRLERKGLECGGRDCKRGDYKGWAGRTEFGFFAKKQTGENWFRWSVYIPEETKSIRPAWTMFTQFKTSSKMDRKGCPIIPLWLNLEPEGIVVAQEVGDCKDNRQLIVPNSKNFKGKWLDFVMHSNWSKKDDGFITLWMNGEKVWSQTGANMLKVSNQYPPSMRFPVYNGKVDKNYTGSQVFYFDAFYSAKTCEEMKFDELGYKGFCASTKNYSGYKELVQDADGNLSWK